MGCFATGQLFKGSVPLYGQSRWGDDDRARFSLSPKGLGSDLSIYLSLSLSLLLKIVWRGLWHVSRCFAEESDKNSLSGIRHCNHRIGAVGSSCLSSERKGGCQGEGCAVFIQRGVVARVIQ